MPFNVLECIVVIFRLWWLGDLVLYLGMVPILIGWSLGIGCYNCGYFLWIWIGKLWDKILDEVEEEVAVETDADSEGEVTETSRLLS